MNFDILLLSPLRKGSVPLCEQTWIFYTQGCFVPSLFEIGLVVPEEKMKMWKGQTNGQMTRIAHLSFQLRLAKKDSRFNTIYYKLNCPIYAQD